MPLLDRRPLSGLAPTKNADASTGESSPLMTPLQAYFVPLQKKYLRPSGHSLNTAISGLFFVDRMERKNVVVWLVAFHYLPVLAMLLTVTVNCMLHVFMSLVFPLIEDSQATFFTPLMAHAGVFLGVCVLGYKIMCVVLDAMVDSCLYVVDPKSKELVSFYTLLHELQSIYESRWSVALLVGSLTVLPLGAWEIMMQDVFAMNWSTGDSTMFRWCSLVFAVAATSLSVSFSRLFLQSKSLSADAVMEWWRLTLPRIRRRCAYAIVVAAAYVFLEGGGSEGMLSFSEGMIYLVTPHLFVSLAGRLVLFERKLRMFLLQTLSNPKLFRTTLQVLSPLAVLLALSYFYFESLTIFCIQLPPLLVMIVTLRRVAEDTSNLRQPTSIALQLYFCNTKNLQRRMPHFKAGILVRFALRAMLVAILGLILTLGVWVTLQQEGIMMGERPTRCERIGTDDQHIKVSTSFMTADLYGLPMDGSVDPASLVFEEHSFLYDKNRYSALCSRKWHNVLHAADLAFFSLVAYLDGASRDLNDSFDFYKQHRVNGTDWVVVPRPPQTSRGVVFHHFRSEKDRVSVLAVRGTALGAPHDFLQNILIFAETAIFQLLGSLVPLGSLISDRVKADFFALSSIICSSLFGEDVRNPRPHSHYYHLQLEHYIDRHVPTGDRVILTGHSLGGVVAQLVGARRQLLALAFSSPGIGLMYKKYGIAMHSIDAYTSNVVASNDVLPLVDRLSGTVHHIQCEHTRAQICHSIELHTIRMWSMCQQYREVIFVNGSYAITAQPHEAFIAAAWDAVLGRTRP